MSGNCNNDYGSICSDISTVVVFQHMYRMKTILEIRSEMVGKPPVIRWESGEEFIWHT
jgi:hypothetical protein